MYALMPGYPWESIHAEVMMKPRAPSRDGNRYHTCKQYPVAKVVTGSRVQVTKAATK